MPYNDDFFDFDHNGNPDTGHDDSCDNGFFGHGGFVNYNHFERSEFFGSSKGKGGNLNGFSKAVAYLIYGGAIALIGLITCFILFS